MFDSLIIQFSRFQMFIQFRRNVYGKQPGIKHTFINTYPLFKHDKV